MKKRNLLVLLLAFVFIVSVFTSCTSDKPKETTKPVEKKEETKTGETKEEETETNAFEGVVAKIFLAAIDENTEKLLHNLEGPLGFELDIMTAPWDQWAQKVNTMMATGADVDLISCEESLPWRAWAQDELVMPLDDLIDPVLHPYINSITNASLFAGYKEDGKRYFLPNAHEGSNWGLIVRQDIMDSLGVEKITDMNQYYDVMKQANEEFGVYGLTIALEDGLCKLQNATHIFAAFGGGGYIPQSRSFDIMNGVVEEKSISLGTKNALTYINRLYRENLINKDYATIKAGMGETYIDTAQTFSFFVPAGIQQHNAKIATLDPTYKYSLHEAVEANSPDFYPITNGFNMWQMSFIPETAQNPEAALAWFEFVCSREGREMIVGGFKGVTYTEDGFTDDGLYTPIPEGREAEWGSPVAKSRSWGIAQTVYGYIPVEDYATYEEAYDNKVIFATHEEAESGDPLSVRNIIKTCKPYASYNEISEVPLPIETEVRSKLNNVKGEYWNKIIMAEDPDDIDALWDEYVSEWKSTGGDDYVAAYQELYDSLS